MIGRAKRQTKRRHSARPWPAWRIDSAGESRLLSRAVLVDLAPATDGRPDVRDVCRAVFAGAGFDSRTLVFTLGADGT